MRWIDTVASYLPSLIVNHLINRTTNEELPSRQEYDTVCLFADVSGFTALSEAMMSSTEGVEGLAKHLNAYFGQMVKIIASEGGDVFKFAGDALIVLWPPPAREALTDIAKNGREKESGEREDTTPMERRVRRAAQCAFAIQEELHDAELTKEVRLCVKIGIGMGKVSVLHLGGVYKRMEYIAVGEPLLQAFTAEHHAEPGDVIISMQAHKLVKDHFHNKHLFPDSFCRIGKEQNYNPMRKQNKVNMLKQSLDDPLLEVKVKGYIPGAVLRNLRPDSPEDEHWSNEIRRVTVLFVNLGVNDRTLLAAAVYDEAMKEMHRVMVAVQESVYEYEGSINKFLMDDKGSTLLAVYGLPPVGHADDPIRGVLAALRLCERLFELAKVGSVGITTGEAFCGVVGSKTRKEYTILGDSVNLAARLMQRAVSEDGGVMCELATKRACGGLLQFKGRGDFRIKGKTAAAKVFQPYPEDFPKPKPPQYLGANVYGLIHQQQRQNYAMHKLLTSLQAYFARPAPAKEISNVSSPSSEHRQRFSGSALGSQRGGSVYMRNSMVSSAGHDLGAGDEEEEQEDTLLGLGGHNSEASDEEGSVGILEHAELQEPSYHPNAALHLPFQTGPLPLEMDGKVPCEGLRQDMFHTEPRGGGVEVDVENGAALPAGLSESGQAATATATAAAPRLEVLKKSMNSRHLLSDPQQPDGRQAAGGDAERGGAGAAGGAASSAAADGETIAALPPGKDPMQKSSSLTAKVFAIAHRGSSGSGGRFSAASAASVGTATGTGTGTGTATGTGTGTGTGTALSGDGGGDHHIFPDNVSPTSNATSNGALPARELGGRRQGDSFSSHLQKLFRTADDGNGGSSSQPTSPSSQAARKEDLRSTSTRSLLSSSALRKEDARNSSTRSLLSAASVPSVLATGPAIGTPTAAPGTPAAAEGAPSDTGSAGGGASRRSSLGPCSGGAAAVGPRLVSSKLQSGVSGSGDPSTTPGGWPGRKGPGGGRGGVGARRDSMKEAEAEGGGADQEGKMEMRDEAEEPSSGDVGDSKEELVPSHSNRGSFSRASFNRGSFTRGSFTRGSFTRGLSGTVLVDGEEVLTTKARRTRSSRRLSISQNGMVPLPASAGIPPSDLGASGSCSLPRYARFPKHPFVGGLGSSGHGSIRNAPPQNAAGASQALSWGGFGPVPPPPAFAGSSSLLTTYIPSTMKNGKRMDDSTSSSTASASGGVGMRAHQAAMNGDGYDECRLQVVVPRSWKWSSLPELCHRLPAINTHEIPTFKALVDYCWEVACGEAEVKGWPGPAPARENMVLNILGTRVMLPTEPDYDISLLPHFVKEACGTRGFKGFMDRKRSFTPDHNGMYGGGTTVDLCLVPRAEIINVQSRWLNSRISLLQHKIALVAHKTGSVLLLEGLPGSGKTEALSVFAARTMPRTALIHFTAASPYHANKSFGGWSMVLQQYLDSLHKLEAGREREDLSGHSNGHSGVRRPSVPPGSGGEQANGASILGQKPLGHRDRMLQQELELFPEMHAYAFLVNDVLGTSLPNNVVTRHHSSASSSSTSVDGMNESDDDDYEESSSVGHKQKLRLLILLQLVKNMASTKRRVVVIDDAQFLDKESWTLALHVATGGPMGTALPLMLILSFRPLLHYRGIFASIAPDYKALTELEHVHFLKISGAPPEEVEELVTEKLGTNVVEISDSLFGLTEELCSGNPLMITELVSHLKMMEPKQLRYFEIRSEEGDQGDSHNNIDVAVQVSLDESFCLSDCLLPEKINALLTSQTDRLNSCQLMALKVASLIGKEFSTWFLYEVYPIKGHKNRLLRELAALEDQGYLVEVQGPQAAVVIEKEGWPRPSIAALRGMSSAGSNSGSCGDSSTLFKRSDSSRHLWGIPNIVYKFTHGFMMEMLQLKMLKSQTNLLKGSIEKLKERLETQKRHKMFRNYTQDRTEKQKSGTLSVMKYKVTMSQAATNARESTRRRKDSVTSRAMRRVKRPVQQKWTEALDWKRRTCLLTGESLSLFSDPKDTKPSQVVYLSGANAEPELGQAFKDSAFRVETNKWKKGDELVDGSERRTFTFLAEDKDEKERWLHHIRHCIEVLKVLSDEAGSSHMDRMLQVSSGRSNRFRSSEAGLNDGMEYVDSTLMVRVEGADELILEDNYGKVYPYCLVDLDDQNCRTSSVQCASVKPSWQEDLTFEVSVQQWVLSNLRIQVWNKDLFLTDDFLGHVTIPLKDVAVQKWDDDVDAPAPELKWYHLESRGRTKRATGRLQLGVRLLMNKSTSARATAVGGVDKLKAIAERRMDISSHAARVGQIQQRKQSLPGLLHHVSQSSDTHNAHHHPHHHHPHHHHHHHHPGAAHMMMPNQQPMLRGSNTNPNTYIRASIRSMETELESSGGRGAGQALRGRLGSTGGRSSRGAEAAFAGGRSQSYLQPQELGDSSRHSDRSGGSGGHEGGDGAGAAAAAAAAMPAPAPRMSGRSRRRSTGGRKGARRTASDSSSCTGIGLTATETLHTDPLTRQLMLMLMAVETKAKVSMPAEGGGGVNRDWIKMKLTELLPMVGRTDVDLDQLDAHTFYCKDRKENQYGPFPAKQLVEAHNAGYINDRKILVKEARMRGEFRPMGARSLMHGPSSDEAFKSLTVWPQVDAHHPLKDRILSPADGSSKDFREWGFNIFGLEAHELGMLAATVLAETGLPRVFGISMKTFAHFMSAVGFFMGRNPRVSYHNLYHAVDVMHATYLTLGSMGASGLLTETEQLALILSALCHDLDHPGLTNSFQTATESPLANLYNDQAPLEHHHLAIMFQILRREGCDILGHLEKPQKRRIREVMIQGILATEMSEHGTHITKVDKLTSDFPSITHRIAKWAATSGGDLENNPARPNYPGPSSSSSSSWISSPPLQTMDGQCSSSGSGACSRAGLRTRQVPGAEAAALGLEDCDRLAVASALLHAADLSSPGRPFATCEVWVLRLLEEFKFQAEQERQHGLRVTVLEGSPSASQPSFINAFLLPFFTALLPVAPGLNDEYIPNLRENRDRWAAIAEQEAQLGLQVSAQLGRNPGKPGDRSSIGSTSSSVGGGGRYSGTDSNFDGGDGQGYQQQALPHSNHSSLTFGGQRRYSGGTIGIASMLGSLSTVSTGRSISDGGMDRRVSSVLGTQETPPEFMAMGNNAAWRRQSAMAVPRAGAGEGGLGYPRWGSAARATNGPLGGAGWEEEAAAERGGGVEGALAVTAGAGVGGGVGSGAGWSIDIGVEGGDGEVSRGGDQNKDPSLGVAAEDSPVEDSPVKGKAEASSSALASPGDGRSPVRDAVKSSVAEASPVAVPEALPE
eukprot:g15291.t1